MRREIQAEEVRAKLFEVLLSKEDDHMKRGLKTLNAARDGHETVHGSEDKKRERWETYQKEIDKLHANFRNILTISSAR